MRRLNLLLLILVGFCAIQVVDSQHTARSLFVELGKEQQAERQIEVAFTRLQLQQITLAKGERIDEVARTRLKMKVPDPNKVIFMALDGHFHE